MILCAAFAAEYHDDQEPENHRRTTLPGYGLFNSILNIPRNTVIGGLRQRGNRAYVQNPRHEACFFQQTEFASARHAHQAILNKRHRLLDTCLACQSSPPCYQRSRNGNGGPRESMLCHRSDSGTYRVRITCLLYNRFDVHDGERNSHEHSAAGSYR